MAVKDAARRLVKPKPGAYVTLAILFVMNALNFTDRNILSGMLPLIKDEWKVSDQMLGILVAAFVITYTILSPVFGWFGDRYIRKWIMGAGVAMWGLATAMSAAAENSWELVGCRMVLGLGIAGFAAMAPTIITDLYPRHVRSKVLGFYYTAIPIGYAFGYVFGGQIGVDLGWRRAFLLVGVPTLIMALGTFFITEPVRGQSEEVSKKELSRYLSSNLPPKAYRELSRNKSYVYCTLGKILMIFAMGGLATWMPTYFYRIKGIPLEQADTYFGITTLLAGILGTFLGGWLGDKPQPRLGSSHFVVSGFGMLASVPCAVIALLTFSPLLYWIAVFAAEFFLFLCIAPSNAILVNVTTPKIRATAFAVSIFVTHALGDLVSPVLIGLVSDISNLHTSLLIIMPLSMTFGGAIFLMGIPHMATDTERMLQAIKTTK